MKISVFPAFLQALPMTWNFTGTPTFSAPFNPDKSHHTSNKFRGSMLRRIVRCVCRDKRTSSPYSRGWWRGVVVTPIALIPTSRRLRTFRLIGNPRAGWTLPLYGNVGQIYHSGLTVQFSYLHAAGYGSRGLLKNRINPERREQRQR